MPDIERLKRFQREKEERERWAAEFESRQPEKGLFPFAESLVDVPMGQSNESHIPVIRVKLPENAKEFSKTMYGCSIGFNKQEMSWKELSRYYNCRDMFRQYRGISFIIDRVNNAGTD